MGAKTPSKLKLRRPTYKCDECPKKFLSTQALKSHQYCVHKIKGNKRPVRSKQAKAKLTTLLGKSVQKEEDTAIKTHVEHKSSVRKGINTFGDADECAPVSDLRKIEFECPQCLKMFSVYFSAFRHIQKFHSINAKGQKVSPNSADLIKPVRVERCVKCDMRIRNRDIHSCSDTRDPELLALSYSCTGCQQQFSSIQMFDLHVSGLHCDKIDSLFFSTTSEFLLWKAHMENVTKIKYLVLAKCNSKQTYRCTFLPVRDNSEDHAYFCPSSIVVREYSKGIQVHFYKQHHGHKSPEYSVPEKYKKYAITELMLQSPAAQFDCDDDKDLYVQFKKLMDNIVVDAAKLNIQTLKVLLGKALEMTTVLNAYDEDDLENIPKNINKCMTDEQITNALNDLKNLKKKVNPEPPKIRVKNVNEMNTPKIVNTFSLAKETNKDTIKEIENVTEDKSVTVTEETPTSNQTVVLSPASISSFNDSYRDFVDKNFKLKTEINKAVKTYSNLQNKSEVRCKVDENVNNNINVDKKLSDKVDKLKRVIKKINGNNKTSVKKPNIIKKAVVKTKIGQFKPSLSPKKVEVEKKMEPRKSIGSGAKVDLHYEVKEQENDCNILILKI